ncbi:MAG: response regulator [Phycisphaerae bacterium]|nr:response regulator [Planctomycetota bacterium]MBL7218509.1 response regulator [Phycisphaerae bacterium]
MVERVMLVDDDPAIQRVVSILLLEAGYDLSVVDSGRKCLEDVRNGFKGLILMDIMMPDLDGWDTIGVMVEEGLVDGVAICLFSALHDMAPNDSNLERYIIGRLPKPFTCDELLNSVRECLVCMR